MSDERTARSKRRDRKGWLAGILGLFIPGLGHLYAGRLRHALIWAGLGLSAGLVLTVLGFIVGPTFPVVVAAVVIGWTIQIASCATAVRAARSAERPFQQKPYNRLVAYIGFAVVLVLASQFISHMNRTHVAEALKFPSGSMEPTILTGEHLMVDRTISGAEAAKPGNIVTFTFPRAEAVDYLAERPADERLCVDPSMLEVDDRQLAKRVAATGGQTVSIINGELTIDGEPVDRTFLSKEPTGGSLFPYSVIERETLPSGATYQIRHHEEPWPAFNLTVPDDHVFVLGDNRDNSSDSRCWGTVPVGNINALMSWIWWSSGEEGLRTDRVGLRIH